MLGPSSSSVFEQPPVEFHSFSEFMVLVNFSPRKAKATHCCNVGLQMVTKDFFRNWSVFSIGLSTKHIFRNIVFTAAVLF